MLVKIIHNFSFNFHKISVNFFCFTLRIPMFSIIMNAIRLQYPCVFFHFGRRSLAGGRRRAPVPTRTQPKNCGLT